jgi:heat shock protein HslJ
LSTTNTSRVGQAKFNNLTFRSNWTPSGQAKLTNGEYRAVAAPGSASHIVVKLTESIVFGKIRGKDVAVAILVTAPGGSGTFYDVALLINGPEGWNNTGIAFLGDRVKIHTVGMEEDKIVIDMITHGLKDPLCCPTHRITRAFAIQDDQLIEVAKENRGATREVVVNTVWKWQQTLENNDTKAVPSNPDHYTLKLLPEGRVSIRADCNQAGGAYTSNGTRLSIEITHTTMAACPPESLEQRFVRYLNAAAGYFVEGDALYIDLKYDTGTMKFSR